VISESYCHIVDNRLSYARWDARTDTPKKPSEALIQQLAKAKVLEPATGKPMPGSPAFIKASSPVPKCTSGQPCPQAGYWKAVWVINKAYAELREGDIRRFEENEIMPTLTVASRAPRFLLPDRITVGEENIEWHLLG